ncbi:MAG: hypothetical protein AAB480_03185 [Patescibacteria group bacterium]
MKIVIATGIYPPDIGGPAYYAKGLEDALRALGHGVETVVYGDLRTWPMGASHLMYLFRIWPHLRGADAVIALDTASVAVPAWFASRIRGVRLIVRTGGDFVWEHYIERTGDLLPLVRFYSEHKPLSLKERLIYALTRLVVRRSVLVFSTEMQRDVWLRPYGLNKERTHVVGNAIDAPLAATAPAQKNFLWYVRPNAIKNGAHVHSAFAKAKERHPDIVLEEGMVPQEKLLERMKGCYAVILPSVTEISPNYILDALRFKKPFILDKYSGYAKWLAPYGLLVDPLDEDDIARAVGELADESGYAKAVAKAAAFSFTRTYEEVARDFLALMND